MCASAGQGGMTRRKEKGKSSGATATGRRGWNERKKKASSRRKQNKWSRGLAAGGGLLCFVCVHAWPAPQHARRCPSPMPPLLSASGVRRPPSSASAPPPNFRQQSDNKPNPKFDPAHNAPLLRIESRRKDRSMGRGASCQNTNLAGNNATAGGNDGRARGISTSRHRPAATSSLRRGGRSPSQNQSRARLVRSNQSTEQHKSHPSDTPVGVEWQLFDSPLLHI